MQPELTHFSDLFFGIELLACPSVVKTGGNHAET
jgi:hypothetical protein